MTDKHDLCPRCDQNWPDGNYDSQLCGCGYGTTEYVIATTKHGYVGNSVLFWGPNNSGYTTDLNKCGRYTRKEAEDVARTSNGEASAHLLSEMMRHAEQTIDASILAQFRRAAADD